MPNVMGREFPYTPQGMAEAQQYRQALGMRDGGSMGFRPVGYADGDAVDPNTQTYRDFDRALKEMPVENLNAYLYDNMSKLKSMAEENPARGAQLADVLEKSGFEGYMLNLMQGAGQVPEEQGGNLGRINTPPQGMHDFPGYEQGTGDFYPPQMGGTTAAPAGMLVGAMPRSVAPPEGGDQMIMQRPPPPVQRAGGGILSLGRR